VDRLDSSNPSAPSYNNRSAFSRSQTPSKDTVFISLCHYRSTTPSGCAAETGTLPGSLPGTPCFASLSVVRRKAPEMIVKFHWKAGGRMTLVLLFTWIVRSPTLVLQVQWKKTRGRVSTSLNRRSPADLKGGSERGQREVGKHLWGGYAPRSPSPQCGAPSVLAWSAVQNLGRVKRSR